MRRLLLLVILFAHNLQAEHPFLPAGGGSPDEMAGQAYGAGGCGLGAVLWGSEPGLVQAWAVTTNLIAFNQSFGLSFGTLGCLSEDKAQEAAHFSNENREILLSEIARGEGETVAALGDILHCPTGALAAQLQSRFETVVPSSSPPEFGARLIQNVRADGTLSTLCGGPRS